MTTDIVIEKKTTTIKEVKEPGKYKVVICNDDVTPVEFVVALLVSVFKHDEAAAIALTLKIHNDGSATAGVYRFEVAEQKAIDATNMARNNDFPLVTKVLPE
jgi:ATP-dependent Clp protease adaptor protein ClpS